MSRLTIDISEQQHKNLKANAALHGKTIREFAIERLFPLEGDEDQAWEELKELLNKRIENAEANGFSKRTILDIADDGMRRFKVG